jgi:hypothetical protein
MALVYHKSLTDKHFRSGKVMKWRMFLEEYSPDLILWRMRFIVNLRSPYPTRILWSHSILSLNVIKKDMTIHIFDDRNLNHSFHHESRCYKKEFQLYSVLNQF